MRRRIETTRCDGRAQCPGFAESKPFELAPGNLAWVELWNAATNSVEAALAEAK